MDWKNNRLFNYLRESYKELHKVTWPTKKQATKYTLVVIGISIFVAAFLGGLDFLFSYLLSLVIS